MYAPAYGYGPGNTSAQAQQGPFNPNTHPNPNNPNSIPNPNGVPTQHPHQQHLHQPQPQTQTPHHPQQQQPHIHQQHHLQQPGQQPQQQQHMMYNPSPQVQVQAQAQAQTQAQLYANMGQPSAYGSAGPIGMMQNNGMAQMPTSHVSPYQTPYSSSPYGGNIPTSTGANMPQNFMPTASNAPSFPMGAPSMNPQHQAQRMQPPPPSSTPTQQGQRASPFPGVQHNTPPNAGQVQSQFSTPQTNNQTLLQTPNHNQQPQPQTVITPQTPNFPPGANSGGPVATPLSPGSESREKERVTLLLEINNGLLKEVMRVQAIQADLKEAAVAGSPEGADKEKAEKEKAEKMKQPSREYVECMRRLQSNLAYLAAIADRSHKPSSQIPPHPAIMSAPPLSPRVTPANSTSSPQSETKKEETEEKKVSDQTAEDQAEILKDLYSKLQALFPGVDPKKEPPIPTANPATRPQQPGQPQMQVQGQGQPQKPGQTQGPGQMDPNAQQKMQNDMLRQKMMQQQQQQQAQNQHAQNQGMMPFSPQQLQQQQGQPQPQQQVQNR